ncbi:hypothetical protein AB0C96_22550 [Streptomyces sp. NPDC048506]|uniref:hypothetical protein n=1 Tax=Streptomyces sp. NPDC048506 TaxID=3155028 RepID=UPI003413CE03
MRREPSAPPAVAPAAPPTRPTTLRPGAIGTGDLVFFVVAEAAAVVVRSAFARCWRRCRSCSPSERRWRSASGAGTRTATGS